MRAVVWISSDGLVAVMETRSTTRSVCGHHVVCAVFWVLPRAHGEDGGSLSSVLHTD